MRGWIGIWLGLSLLPNSAAARDVLDWLSPDGCPTAEAARDQVATLRGRPLASEKRASQIRVRVVRLADELWEAEVSADTGGSQRLRAKDCDVLTRAAAVVVALALESDELTTDEGRAPANEKRSADAVPSPPAEDERSRSTSATTPASPRETVSAEVTNAPAVEDASSSRSPSDFSNPELSPDAADAGAAREAVAAREGRESAPPAVTPAPSRVQVDAAAASGETNVERAPSFGELPQTRSVPFPDIAGGEPTRLFIGLCASLGLGVQPDIAPAGSLYASVVRDSWIVAAGLGYAPAQTTAPLSTAGGARLELGLALGTLQASWRSRFAPWELLIGGATEAGVFVARGADVARTQLATPGWWSIGFSVGVRAQITAAMAFGLYGSGQLAVLRPHFVLRSSEPPNEQQPVFRPAPLVGRVGLYFEVRVLP